MFQKQLQPMNIDSPLRWKGGKHGLRQEIVSLIPKHIVYVEVFMGAGWVFYYKPKSKVEVINDINGDLMNFYRCVKNNFDELVASFEWDLYSRELFDSVIDARNTSKTDIQKAHDFFIENRSHFGANMDRDYNWGYSRTTTTNGCHFNFDNFKEFILPAYKRLAKVFIENDTFDKILSRYDSEDTFFFCDPPYFQTEGYNKTTFGNEEYILLKNMLTECKGRWLVTLNRCDYVSDLFKGYYFKDTNVNYSIGGGNNQVDGGEVIITNYPLKETIKHGLGISSLEEWCSPKLEA